eukprot:Pgem_evm1s3906
MKLQLFSYLCLSLSCVVVAVPTTLLETPTTITTKVLHNYDISISKNCIASEWGLYKECDAKCWLDSGAIGVVQYFRSVKNKKGYNGNDCISQYKLEKCDCENNIEKSNKNVSVHPSCSVVSPWVKTKKCSANCLLNKDGTNNSKVIGVVQYERQLQKINNVKTININNNQHDQDECLDQIKLEKCEVLCTNTPTIEQNHHQSQKTDVIVKVNKTVSVSTTAESSGSSENYELPSYDELIDLCEYRPVVYCQIDVQAQCNTKTNRVQGNLFTHYVLRSEYYRGCEIVQPENEIISDCELPCGNAINNTEINYSIAKELESAGIGIGAGAAACFVGVGVAFLYFYKWRDNTKKTKEDHFNEISTINLSDYDLELAGLSERSRLSSYIFNVNDDSKEVDLDAALLATIQ